MEEFLIYAILAGISMACSLCPMGVILLWKKLPYFGDAIAHAAIFGVVIGIMLHINITLSVIAISIVFGLILVSFRQEKIEGILTIILTYTFLALGLFLLVFMSHNPQVDIFSYLFGDILLVSNLEIKLISVVSVLVLIWLYFRWKDLLLMSINEDLAVVEGINIHRLNLEFLVIVAFLVGISIKIIGTLLVGSMIIIPAAAARNFSNSPVAMLVLSIILGILSVVMGIALSYIVDSASGASIILSASFIFLISMLPTIVKSRFS